MFLILVQLFLIPLVFAQEDSVLDGDKDLLASCNVFSSSSDQVGAMQCKYYIQGFLAGLWSADRVMLAEPKEGKAETFFERAYRVRVGAKNDRSNVGSPATYFCSSLAESQVGLMALFSNESAEPFETIENINAKIHEVINVICLSDEQRERG